MSGKRAYKAALRALQIELVKLQRDTIARDRRLLILLEGRDAAGKDGIVKRIVAHLSPRETRVVALGKPSDRERGSWYFQRFTAHLPSVQEIVVFNRSWYNRAGVERVMGFCTEAEHEEFMHTVVEFEHMLSRAGIDLLKYYIDISRQEQVDRLAARRRDPLKQWKISPIDAVAVERWDAYSAARNQMLARTHNSVTPWTVVRGDHKRKARLNMIRDLLARLDYDGKDEAAATPNSDIVYRFDEDCLHDGRLAR